MADESEGKGKAEPQRVDRRLLELLVCPLTKSALVYDEAAQELISRQARLAYPIRSGVPCMIPSEARHLDDPPRKGPGGEAAG